MPGLNHVTGQCWEYDTRITSSTANRSRRELTASESRRPAAPSRRAGRNTSFAEFRDDNLAERRVDNLLFRPVPTRSSALWTVFLFSAFFPRFAALCRSFTATGRNERVSRGFPNLPRVNRVNRRPKKRDFDL